METYFLKLHWQILFTKIDEEPHSSEYTLISEKNSTMDGHSAFQKKE